MNNKLDYQNALDAFASAIKFNNRNAEYKNNYANALRFFDVRGEKFEEILSYYN